MAIETGITQKSAPPPPSGPSGGVRRGIAALITGFVGMAWIGVGASIGSGTAVAIGSAFVLAAILAWGVEMIRRA
mgnify:CR=1 FL=1